MFDIAMPRDPRESVQQQFERPEASGVFCEIDLGVSMRVDEAGNKGRTASVDRSYCVADYRSGFYQLGDPAPAHNDVEETSRFMRIQDWSTSNNRCI